MSMSLPPTIARVTGCRTLRNVVGPPLSPDGATGALSIRFDELSRVWIASAS